MTNERLRSEQLINRRDEIIIKCYNEGWNYPKIAGYIGIPMTTVRDRITVLIKFKKLERRGF